MKIPILILDATMRTDARQDPDATNVVSIFTLTPESKAKVMHGKKPAVDWHPGETSEEVFEELAWEMLMQDLKAYTGR